MIEETVLSRAVRLMYSGGVVVGLSFATSTTLAQDIPAGPIQRVEITGSSIKRIAAEGALPVQTLSRAQIDQSGASNVADLVAGLPSMQGFTTASTSVNGGGGGLQTASIHAIGEGYTLVLLNGRRLAPATSGSTVNLASIPLSAVERVEILTDGANTLYGSDAIAGVVNFILKKNKQDFHIEAGHNRAQKSAGGKTSNVAVSKGWGDLDTDGYNILLSASHDRQAALQASERDFSKSGVIPFSENGKNYNLYQLSGNSIPAQAVVRYTDSNGAPGAVQFGPNLLETGKCNGPALFQVGMRCLYDYASTVQLLPQLERTSIFGSANYRVNADTTLFMEAVGSKFSSTAQYAPPAQPLGIAVGSALYNKSIRPHLARLNIDPTKVTSASMSLRLADAGGRADEYETEARHLAFGIDGTRNGWDYNAAFTHSENTATDTAAGGYMSLNEFDKLVSSGKFDPFAPPGSAKDLLAPAVLRSELSETKSSLDSVSARASRAIWQLASGAVQLGVGADFSRQEYKYNPSDILQGNNPQQPDFTDAIVGGGAGALPVDASRDNWGAYAELLIPLSKRFDITASTRYDDYTAVDSKKNFDASGRQTAAAELGNDASKATYKVAARWRPVDSVMVRGSYGTGFKVAAMSSIVDPLSNFGSSAFHACPITAPSDPRTALCLPGSAEYNLLKSGNPNTGANGLKPEQSKQATLGIRFEPTQSLSLGFDLWDVKLTNQIQELSEDIIFGNPAVYNHLLVSYFDPIQKQKVLAAILSPLNLSSSHYQGLDWDHTWRTNTAAGRLNLNWTGTYMLRSEQEAPGTGLEKNVGRFNSYSNVTFRLITKATVALRVSPKTTHALTANYRSGYTDQEYSVLNTVVNELNPDGTQGKPVAMTREVDKYVTLDWQTKFSVNPALVLTGGVKNLLDEEPPFTIRNAGGGNQSGYDGRYADPLGRQFYLNASYRF